ncbi:hypothetical protein PYW07_014730 [Mythimna separata]|uniref:Uncharacterized protein n=1 Tax=Mythimna separata TaxID=271217 RepID=A0AAD7Z1F3_MYTSE|nr:hypothetical protein PYW07_014730 [Mythimna separata]
MFSYLSEYRIILFGYWIQTALSMSLLNKNPLYLVGNEAEADVSEYIVSKGYLPHEKDLPKTAIIKNGDGDVTYLLSKLSDDELIKLLREQPNKIEYNLKDIVKIATESKDAKKFKTMVDLPSKPLPVFNDNFENLKKNKRFQKVSDTPKSSGAFFRLENKEVDPYSANSFGDPQYAAIQKLNNLLYSRPSEVDVDSKDDDEDEKKELLFDVLVAQLKTLCCKRSKPTKKKDKSPFKLKALLNDIMPQEIVQKPYLSEHTSSQTMPNEQMFLIINEEIKSNGSDDGLISVDPESLGSNSSVMFLGPIATPLSEAQLKIVMTRITNELSKPEYMPLLQQIADGTLSDDNIRLVNSLVSGPQTRRYIKPHRCNHQSRLAKIHDGGPKWLICTGYLNINTPSLYD